MPASEGAFVPLAQLLRDNAAAFVAMPPDSSTTLFGAERGAGAPESATRAPSTPAQAQAATRPAASSEGAPAARSARPPAHAPGSPAHAPAAMHDAAHGPPLDESADGRYSALPQPTHGLNERPAPASASEARALRDARLFGAALADAFELRLAGLLSEIAAGVLSRELRLAPADIGALAQRLLAEYAAQEPIRLRVAPGDADILCALPLVVDPALAPGDAVLECRSGEIDARLTVRLAAAVEPAR